MKFTSFLVVVLLGVLVFSVIGDRLHLNLPAPLQTVSTTFNGFVSSASSGLRGNALVVPANEPRQTVHVKNIARIKGQVVKTIEGAVVVDCDYQAPIPREVSARYRQIAQDRDVSAASMNSLAQGEADQAAFGKLVMLDENGSPKPSEFNPANAPTGKVILRGMAVAPGATVNVITAPLGKTANGEPVYTAKIAIQGGAWMWGGNRGTLLDKPEKFERLKPIKEGL